MKLVETTDPEALSSERLIAESNEFAIYDVGNDTYTLVHRHKAVAWQAITISGDGLFRVTELLVGATRALYRDVACDLSRQRRLEAEGLKTETADEDVTEPLHPRRDG